MTSNPAVNSGESQQQQGLKVTHLHPHHSLLWCMIKGTITLVILVIVPMAGVKQDLFMKKHTLKTLSISFSVTDFASVLISVFPLSFPSSVIPKSSSFSMIFAPSPSSRSFLTLPQNSTKEFSFSRASKSRRACSVRLRIQLSKARSIVPSSLRNPSFWEGGDTSRDSIDEGGRLLKVMAKECACSRKSVSSIVRCLLVKWAT